MVHYQSGEDVVIVLCHHPHHLGLEEEEEEGEGVEKKINEKGHYAMSE